MINYVIQHGDSVNTITFRYQTTKAILQEANPGIDFNNLKEGTILKIQTTTEYAKNNAVKAVNMQTFAVNKKAEITSPTVVLEKEKVVPIKLAGVTIDNNDIQGVVKWSQNGAIYQITEDGRLVEKEKVSAGARYKYYGTTNAFNGLYVLGGTNVYAKKSETKVEMVKEALYTADASIKTSPTAIKTPNLSIPQFQEPGYKRSRLKVKNSGGTYETIELRLTSFVPSYGSQFSPSRTNAGWMIAVGGANLLSISISGFWLDTVGNPEAKDFIEFYKNHLVPKNDVDYFSAEVVTLLHKGWEYKGVIISFTMADEVATPLDRKFQMQFLSFKDTFIARDLQNSSFTDVVKRDGADNRKNELDFRSDIKKMLSNPISGTYMTDHS